MARVLGAVYTCDFVCDFMCDLHANRRRMQFHVRFHVRQESLPISVMPFWILFHARFCVRCSIHSAADLKSQTRSHMKSHGTCKRS
jgi:hypothetical protein